MNTKQDQSARAAELYAEGKSVNAVAKELGVTWHIAGKLRPAAPEIDEDAAPADDSSDAWDVTITIPTERADSIFATFADAEKFSAIQFVLQTRMDTALEGE